MTPTIRQGVYGSYSELDYSRGVLLGGVANQDPKKFRIGSNLVWSPVSGLDIGVEALNAHAEAMNRIQAAGSLAGVLIKSEDAISARLRTARLLIGFRLATLGSRGNPRGLSLYSELPRATRLIRPRRRIETARRGAHGPTSAPGSTVRLTSSS